MYVISMLCMLKIYQTRHPDINAEAHAAFAVLAFVVLLGVISVFQDSLGFRIVFAAIHLLACLALSAQVYYMGRWRLDLGVFKRIYLVCWNDFQAGPSNVSSKLIFILDILKLNMHLLSGSGQCTWIGCFCSSWESSPMWG